MSIIQSNYDTEPFQKNIVKVIAKTIKPNRENRKKTFDIVRNLIFHGFPARPGYYSMDYIIHSPSYRRMCYFRLH